jgi:hypothetical protein
LYSAGLRYAMTKLAKNRHLTTTGHGAVAKKGSDFQIVFRRQLPLGYQAF